MNIVYINHYAGSIHHGMEYRPYYLAREWVKQGHRVTIIASNYSHLRQENVEIPDGLDYLVENIDGIEYIWCKTSPYPANGIKRVINIFQFLRKVNRLIAEFGTIQKFINTNKQNRLSTSNGATIDTQQINKSSGFAAIDMQQINNAHAFINQKPDLVIASSTYPFDAKVANKIAKITNAKFIYEVHDLWPLTPIEVGGMSKYHPFIWLMQRAEDFAYKHADKVVSLLPKAIDYMQSRGMQRDKFIYIPNGVDVREWYDVSSKLPNEHQNILSKIRLEYEFVLGYAGGMGDSNALEYLISAAKDLPSIAIVLVGNGPNKVKLIEEAKSLPNVFFLPAVSKSQIPEFLSRCDALYIGWHNLAIYRFGICPNKLFDYMLAKKPVIHAVSAGNDLVQESNCGISVPAGDVAEIIRAIKLMASLKLEERAKLGNNGYNYVLRNHDYKILATRFLDQCC